MKKKHTHGISFPNPQLLEAAKERAQSLGLSLSGYVNQLVRKDLGMANALAFTSAPTLQAVAEDQSPYGVNTGAAGKVLQAKAEGKASPPTAPEPPPPAPAKDKQ